MGISGNIKTMVLSELLQWLSQGQKTGTLVIDGGKVEKRIYFKEGVIVSSASTDPMEYLGAFLASRGYLTEEELEAAVARQEEEKKLLGQILIGMGTITEEQLKEMLQLKTEESIYDVFTWEEGDFVFLDDELPDESQADLSLDVQWIVLEGSRRMDEWQRIREWVPSPQAVPVLVADVESLDVDEVDQRILAWVDDDRTVAEISQGAQTSLFMIAQTLAQYAQQGVVKVVRPRIVEVEVPVAAEESGAEADQQAPPQMPPGYPQMMPQMMPPMGYPGMPQGYPMAAPHTESGTYPAPNIHTDSGAYPPYNPPPQQPPAVDVGGRTLRFAAAEGAPPGAPIPAGPPAGTPIPAGPPAAQPAPKSEAEALLQEAESSLQRGELHEALESYRKAKTAAGSGPEVEKAAEEGEGKVGEALERDGLKLSAVPRLKCAMEDLIELDISPQEGFMLTRIDGSYDIQSILKMSPMPKLDAQMLFWKLKKSGHVTI